MCTLVYFKFNNFIKCLSTFNTFFPNKKNRNRKKNKRSWQNLNKNYFVLRSECEDTMLIFGII